MVIGPVVDNISSLEVIGWASAYGVGLAPGWTVGVCAECGESIIVRDDSV